MVYSCAYFTDWTNDLATAQRDKLEMICRKLRLKAGERMLDIGCGWGGLACYAAQNYGVHVHALTLSEQQVAYARDKIARLGLQRPREHRPLGLTRRCRASSTRSSQIEMFEHLGLDNHPEFFQTIHRLLKPGGLYLHHSCTHPAKANDRKFRKKSAVYAATIRYVFPGGEVDHIGMSLANMERFGFDVHDVESWREHFALTCRHLARPADGEPRQPPSAKSAPEKTRIWLAFFMGCAIGFERSSIGIFQTLASKRTRGPSPPAADARGPLRLTRRIAAGLATSADGW